MYGLSGIYGIALGQLQPDCVPQNCDNLHIFGFLAEYSMKARVKWVEAATFLGESGSGHSVVMDGPPEHGGCNLGIRPMEMVLSGMGGCTAFEVLHILKKARQPVADCEVELEAERAEQDPKVFTRIHVHFIVTGDGLMEKPVHRAVKLSAEKYCSASLMLGKSVVITHDFEIREPEKPGAERRMPEYQA